MTTCNPPTTTLTLERVQENLQQWRESRQYRTQRIPDTLLSEVASLVGRYSKRDILGKLNLSSQKLAAIISTFVPADTGADASLSSSSTYSFGSVASVKKRQKAVSFR